MTQAAARTDEGWSRLHPLTPLLRGGRFVIVLFAVLGQQGLRAAEPVLLAAVLGLGVPAAVLAGWLSWRAMRYRLTPTELQVESGVLTTRSRRVPLARLQSVDVVRPLLARLLGLAELRMEVVGGGAGAEAPLSYLSEDDAEALRVRLLQLASGGAAPDAGHVEPPERVLVVVPGGPLVWSTLLGAPVQAVVALLVVGGVVAAVDLSYVPGLLLASLPLLFGVASFAVRRILTEYGFTVAEAADGLRLQQGLLDKRSSTIPPGRVQTVRTSQPLLWRPFGWVRVEVDVAGYGAGGGEQQPSTGALLPVAPQDLAERLVARVLGGPLPLADVRPPRAARLRAPASYRRLALGLDDRHLVSAYGIATTTTDVVPLAKVQSLRLTQGPLQRRLGLSSVHVDTAGRRLPGTVALHRGDAEGRVLLGELTERAKVARAVDAGEVGRAAAPSGPAAP
ncbi:MAG: transmembrane protein, distant homology with ydbT [uncultured Frankineae bacterium]|uniref:Transmembrane protein, distant homology with ydbT n=1 Tax=uncultured Frankineae bacterium TaxID=437475 RepID=A0A6J4MHN1_9ACTN|nr:MAG: transmembrane protein, distant homology with ydbT [uncultured Frankineae bacterium]